MEHPRWGATMSLLTTLDIEEGQELVSFYGYTMQPFPSDYPWYWELKIMTEKNERLEAKRMTAERAKNNRVKSKTKQKKKNGNVN